MARLSIVACGAPLAARALDVLAAAQEAGWDVALSLTHAAEQWSDAAAVGSADRGSDAVVVCPLTFNTANKWAAGVADTPSLTMLDEVLAAGLPIVAVPMVNETLWRNPAWVGTIERLSAAGVQWVDPATGDPEARPVPHGSGAALSAAFDPAWVLRRL